MNKINYVIATYEGILNKIYHKSCNTENVLQLHLEQLLKLKHNITQITIMKPICTVKKRENYYDLDKQISQFNIPVIFIECENFGYSPGQWMKAYETYKDNFDYYFLIQDDTCPNQNNFDDAFLYHYNNYFSNNIGFLTTHMEGRPYNKNHIYPLHWEGANLISKESFEKVYNFPRWKNEPRKYLDLLNNNDDKSLNKLKKSYKGAYNQVVFSLIFTISEIDHKEIKGNIFNNKSLDLLYWFDLKGIKMIRYSKEVNKNIYNKEDLKKEIDKCIIIPIEALCNFI
jgi:hypothetical protein